MVLGAEHLRSIEHLSGDQGARSFLRGRLVECADLGSPRHLDTPDDLSEIRREAARSADPVG